jgi:hypothetical protein
MEDVCIILSDYLHLSDLLSLREASKSVATRLDRAQPLSFLLPLAMTTHGERGWEGLTIEAVRRGEVHVVKYTLSLIYRSPDPSTSPMMMESTNMILSQRLVRKGVVRTHFTLFLSELVGEALRAGERCDGVVRSIISFVEARDGRGINRGIPILPLTRIHETMRLLYDENDQERDTFFPLPAVMGSIMHHSFTFGRREWWDYVIERLKTRLMEGPIYECSSLCRIHIVHMSIHLSLSMSTIPVIGEGIWLQIIVLDRYNLSVIVSMNAH